MCAHVLGARTRRHRGWSHRGFIGRGQSERRGEQGVSKLSSPETRRRAFLCSWERGKGSFGDLDRSLCSLRLTRGGLFSADPGARSGARLPWTRSSSCNTLGKPPRTLKSSPADKEAAHQTPLTTFPGLRDLSGQSCHHGRPGLTEHTTTDFQLPQREATGSPGAGPWSS